MLQLPVHGPVPALASSWDLAWWHHSLPVHVQGIHFKYTFKNYKSFYKNVLISADPNLLCTKLSGYIMEVTSKLSVFYIHTKYIYSWSNMFVLVNMRYSLITHFTNEETLVSKLTERADSKCFTFTTIYLFVLCYMADIWTEDWWLRILPLRSWHNAWIKLLIIIMTVMIKLCILWGQFGFSFRSPK